MLSMFLWPIYLVPPPPDARRAYRTKRAGEAREEKWRLILIRTCFMTRIDFIEYELARIKSTVELHHRGDTPRGLALSCRWWNWRFIKCGELFPDDRTFTHPSWSSRRGLPYPPDSSVDSQSVSDLALSCDELEEGTATKHARQIGMGR